MDIKPVKEYKTPQYPVKEQIQAETLVKIVPKRWGASAVKIALSALAAMSLTACDGFRTAGVPEPPPIQTDYGRFGGVVEMPATPIIDDILMGEPLAPSVLVAPLFLHGEGRGAFGCIMVAPPVFLSEAEALEVINDVGKEYGLSFSEENTPSFYNVRQPAVRIWQGVEKSSERIDMTLKSDFKDKEHGIVIEYVSVNDVRKWQMEQRASLPEQKGKRPSLIYDMLDAAAQLSEALEYADVSDMAAVMGVLYDPCAGADYKKSDDYMEENRVDWRTLSAEQLELQVRDLFEWLKSQGII